MKKSLLFLILIIFGFISCTSDEEENANENFVGYWVSNESPSIVILDINGLCLYDGILGSWIYDKKSETVRLIADGARTYIFQDNSISKENWTAITADGKALGFRHATDTDLFGLGFFNNWKDADGNLFVFPIFVTEDYNDIHTYEKQSWSSGKPFGDNAYITTEIPYWTYEGQKEFKGMVTFSNTNDLKKLRMHVSTYSKEFMLSSIYDRYYKK